jgi:hypothetical protein
MNANDQDFLYAALRNDFLAFLHRSMLTLHPGISFLLNWHLDAID